MKNILILHGTENDSRGNWFPWLKDKLEKGGWRVWVPDLPDADRPNVKKYNEYIFCNKNWKFGEKSVLIGHSSGAVAILGLLQEMPDKVRVDTCILVGAFKNSLNWSALDGLFEKPFDFERIKSKAKKFIFVHSDNDPHCPLEHAKYLSRKVSGELIVKKGQGHFNLESNPRYKRFPLVLEMVK